MSAEAGGGPDPDGMEGREAAEDLREELERIAASGGPFAERAQRALERLDGEGL